MEPLGVFPPSILLVTGFEPDKRTGGGDIVRFLARKLGPNQLRWFSLAKPAAPLDEPFRSQWIGSLPLRRLGATRFGLRRFWDWFESTIWSYNGALRIAASAKKFNVSHIWFLCDYPIAPILPYLQRLLPKVAIHVSVHDHPVFTAEAVGHSVHYIDRIKKALRKISRTSVSIDTISEELLATLGDAFGQHTVVTLACNKADIAKDLLPVSTQGPLKVAFAGSYLDEEPCNSFLKGLDLWSARTGRPWEMTVFGPNLQFRHPGIQMAGFTQPDRLSVELRKADLLFLPLSFESKALMQSNTSLPTKLITYLNAGRLIVFGVPGESATARIALEGHLGPLITKPTPEMFADAIDQLAGWDMSKAESGRRQLAGNRFNEDRIYDRFYATIQRRETGLEAV